MTIATPTILTNESHTLAFLTAVAVIAAIEGEYTPEHHAALQAQMALMQQETTTMNGGE